MNRPKHILALADLIATAWGANAASDKFAGMTLAQFRAATQPSSDVRDTLVSLKSQQQASRGSRRTADAASRDAVQNVVNSVKSDPDHGADSPLLAAMGYVTRSARKTGKTNKATTHGQPALSK